MPKKNITADLIIEIHDLLHDARHSAQNKGIILALVALTKAILLIVKELRSIHIYMRQRDEIILGGTIKINDPE